MTLVEMLRHYADDVEQQRTGAGPSLVVLLRDAADQLSQRAVGGVFNTEDEWQRHLHELKEWRDKTGGEVVGGTLILEPAEFADQTQADALLAAKIQNVTSSFAASARAIAHQRGWIPKDES